VAWPGAAPQRSTTADWGRAVTEQSGTESDLSRSADLVTPMAIRVAASLRLADHIAGGSATAQALAGASGADAGALDQLLRHLVSLELLRSDGSGRYSLTSRGERLRDSHPSGLRARLDINDALGRAELSFGGLLEAVCTGNASFDALYGRPFWDDLGSDPTRTASYDEQMGRDVAAWAASVVPAYDWGSLGHVVDVGGGNGTLMVALLDAYPGLRGTVFEQPRTADAARSTLQEAGVVERSDVAAGSFFDPLPAGAGGYVLSAVLHDWPDERVVAILRRCADAAGANGRVLVVEKTGLGGEAPSTAMDLRMLVYFGARERGVTAISALAADAGLRTVAVHPAGEISVIEFGAS